MSANSDNVNSFFYPSPTLGRQQKVEAALIKALRGDRKNFEAYWADLENNAHVMALLQQPNLFKEIPDNSCKTILLARARELKGDKAEAIQQYRKIYQELKQSKLVDDSWLLSLFQHELIPSFKLKINSILSSNLQPVNKFHAVAEYVKFLINESDLIIDHKDLVGKLGELLKQSEDMDIQDKYQGLFDNLMKLIEQSSKEMQQEKDFKEDVVPSKIF